MEKIITNKIKCKKCKEIIESKSAHDMVFCKCRNVVIDGGKSYLRRTFTTLPKDDFEELNEVIFDDEKEV